MASTWNKIEIELEESGLKAEAQAPEIISASRSTDIPAFYADWFFHRLKKGYSAWTNPFNGKKSYVSFANTRFIVFWSKNPHPLLKHLDELESSGIGCYIQYTLNDYEDNSLENNVPKLDFRINTFKQLVEKLGKGHVIWRFDPLVLTPEIGIEQLLNKIKNIGDQLAGYTEKLVFSFADIAVYRKVQNNLKSNGIQAIEWTEPMMIEFAKRLDQLNKDSRWGFELATCGEKIDLSQYNIKPNHCIDYNLIVRLANKDRTLMDFIGASVRVREMNLFGEYEPLPANAIDLNDGRYVIRDGGQRDYCGCMRSKDIGQYDTCIHQCEYCYANSSKQMAMFNYTRHKSAPYSDSITG